MTAVFTLRRTLRGYKPLYCGEDGLYLVRRDMVVHADLDLGTLRPVARLPGRHWSRRVPSRLLQRVFRTEPQSAARLADGSLLVARRGEIWRVDPATGAVALDFTIPHGRTLLRLSTIRDATGGTYVVFGEYFDNPDRVAVGLWRRADSPDGRWTRAGEFPDGAINHVHAVHQAQTGEVFVLSGDFGHSAAIWRCSPRLDDPTPVLLGEQDHRACWLHDRDGAFFYATDSQFVTNNVFRARLDDRPAITAVAPIAGSSIYAGRVGDDVVFSSTVEPGETTGSFMRDVVDRRPGPGIAGNHASIYLLDGGRITEQFSAGKDRWPMRLAQFGTFTFPGGVMPTDRFFAYGAAVEGYDGCCLLFVRR